MKAVLQNIEHSWYQSPRDITLIYYNARHNDVFASSPSFAQRHLKNRRFENRLPFGESTDQRHKQNVQADEMKPMRIVMISFCSRRSVTILESLVARNIPVTAVILDRGKLSQRKKLTRTRHILRHSGPGELARRIRRRLRRRLRGRVTSRLDVFRSLVPVVHEVADANGESSVRILTELVPDLVVLGSSRVLRRHVISIPRIGVLNAHPGLLPAYRGVDLIPWALHNGDPLGVTIHLVNAGVDTGAILAQGHFEPSLGDTLSSLRRKSNALMSELMGDVITRLVSTGKVESIKQDTNAGKQYYRMPPSLLAATESKLAERVSG
jgi:methionyl-tRNA formyltransferase